MTAVFENMDSRDHEEIVFCRDKDTGLKAIIAVHNTAIGPALGGCRMWNYENEEAALKDVLRRFFSIRYVYTTLFGGPRAGIMIVLIQLLHVF